MKKALIVATVSGFVPQFEMNNVRILQELGYEVHYASNFKNPHYGKDNGRLKGTGIVCHPVDFVRSPFRVVSNIRAFWQLCRLMRQIPFEIVHCHTPMGGVLGRLAAEWVRREGIRKREAGKACNADEDLRKDAIMLGKCADAHGARVIYTAHGFHFYKGAPLLNWLLYYPVERLLARITDTLVTINKEDYWRAKKFCRRKKTKVYYLPGVGIDSAYFSGKDLASGEREKIREEIRKELLIEENTVVFLSVGELSARKNHTIVIRALAGIRQATCGRKCFRCFHGDAHTCGDAPGAAGDFCYLICGEGHLRGKLQRRINKAGLSGKVRLLGYREDVRGLLYAADVFVFPSKQEGMPVALLEAAAAGIPCIASDIRGNREVVDAEWLFPVGDEIALREKLQKAKAAKIAEMTAEQEKPQKSKTTKMAGQRKKGLWNVPNSKIRAYDALSISKKMRKIYQMQMDF